MCLILFATGADMRYPLIVAANRDEAYSRPTAPASFWSEHPHVYAGRDLEQGGTWLGLSIERRFAAITNYRQGPHLGKAPRSRGELTRNYLTASGEAREYLDLVAQRGSDYRGYSLILGTPDQLYFQSNRSEGCHAIKPGVHGLSNRLLDEPWPKVTHGISILTSLLGKDEAAITAALFELLADRTPASDHLLPSTGIAFERERELSAAFIAGERYGTRASTVMLASATGDVLYCERTFGPHGVLLGSSDKRFRMAPVTVSGTT